MTDASFIPRPGLAFRVGITGARALDAAALPALQQALRQVLGEVKATLETLAGQPETAALYAPGAPLLRMISPLAEGADRLAATAALALGYRLEAPLPFPADEYEHDFPNTAGEFRDLLAAAAPHVLALDGARGEAETRCYEAVGRLVVRNCDLLVAIWDGGKSRGRGGTAEIVRYAARHGLPVWWLHASGQGQPAWLADGAALKQLDACPRGEAAQPLLVKYIEQRVLPNAMMEPPQAGMIGGLLNRLLGEDTRSPLTAMLAEPRPERRIIWSLHGRVMRWAAGSRPKTPAAPPAPAGEVWAYWQRFYEPVDRCAVAYAERYRSSYILVFALAAFAACAAVLGVGIHPVALVSTSVEFALLIGIMVIVGVNERRHWHKRSITYRLLAELVRKQQALALLAWSLPAAEAFAVTGESAAAPVRDVLVGWYFNAVLRAAPLARGTLGGETLVTASAYIRAGLVEGQIAYHANRQEEMERAARRFGRLGSEFFLLTLVAVMVKFLLMWTLALAPGTHGVGVLDRYTILAGFVAALLPALSAAFVGIRGYAELEFMADQSLQMHRVLAQFAERLRHVPLEAPLASQEVGAELLVLAEGMLRDVRGWALLFRVKAVEVG
jgi:hypothetical protein